MSLFIEINKIYYKVKILILGSYHPKYKPILNNLVEFIRGKGFKNANLAEELIKISKKKLGEERRGSLITEIEREMKYSDFNIFVLFPNKNNSVIGELTWLIRAEFYENKQKKVLVLMPFDYNYTIVLDIIEKNKKVNCFRYSNEIELQQKCFVFIKTNLVL
ncbi:MAG: hypothetical protein ACTSQJ_04485 [Promethearchaeota archaeon]